MAVDTLPPITGGRIKDAVVELMAEMAKENGDIRRIRSLASGLIGRYFFVKALSDKLELGRLQQVTKRESTWYLTFVLSKSGTAEYSRSDIIRLNLSEAD